MKRFDSFEDLFKDVENDKISDFHDYFSNSNYQKAYVQVSDISLKEQQQLLYKKDIAKVYYEMFKIKFSNQDFNAASEMIDRACNLDSHYELYLRRRKIFTNRKQERRINIEEAENKLLEQPRIREPNFHYIKQSFSMGVYKWKGDPDRSGHKWSNFISDFKEGDKLLSDILGELLGDYIVKRTNIIGKCDIIVPVASDPVRSYKRGFEITQKLAEGVSNIVAMPICGTYLIKNSNDHARNITKLDLVNSFFSAPEKAKQIKNKSILLIDDICTSGRTLDACAKNLLQGGAKAVYSVVLARAESTNKRIRTGSAISSSGDKKIQKLADWYRLMGSDKLGPVKIKYLIDKYLEPKDVLALSVEELKTVRGIGEKIARGIKEQCEADIDYYSQASKQYVLSEGLNSHIWNITDDIYPKVLLDSKMPITVLHVRGNSNLLTEITKSVAIVGSRDMTAQSKEFIKKTVPQFVEAGWTIISGMAAGVDGEAHLACLEVNGSTVGVLGNGLDIIYPKENSELFNRMIKNGTLISEFNLGARVSEMRLKKRNKVIAGLSHVVLVVQTMPHGGAMNAVRAAIENKRPVITWNGDNVITQEKYSGNREIIDNKTGYEVNSYNIIKQIRTICEDHGKSVSDLSLEL